MLIDHVSRFVQKLRCYLSLCSDDTQMDLIRRFLRAPCQLEHTLSVKQKCMDQILFPKVVINNIIDDNENSAIKSDKNAKKTKVFHNFYLLSFPT